MVETPDVVELAQKVDAAQPEEDTGPSPEHSNGKDCVTLAEAKKNRDDGELKDAKILYEEVLELKADHAEASAVQNSESS